MPWPCLSLIRWCILQAYVAIDNNEPLDPEVFAEFQRHPVHKVGLPLLAYTPKDHFEMLHHPGSDSCIETLQ